MTTPTPGRYSGEPTSFDRFDEGGPDDAAPGTAADDPPGLYPLPPLEALAYFRGLVPTLGTDPQRWGRDHERHAFTLAVAAEQTLLERVQELIRRRIETGEHLDDAADEVEEILQDAGVSPLNAGYSSMVVRTNMMDAYNAGTTREMQDPDVADLFPAWLYSNPADSRSRKHHAEKDGRLYPASAPFVEVRGEDIADVANCRCVQIPVDKYEMAERLAAGEKLEEWPSRP